MNDAIHQPGPAAGVRGLQRWALLLVAVTAMGLFAIRASAPHNFLDKDQERPASYILDALRNGNWICQTDWMDDVTSKPPMLTWIGALLALLFGSASPVVLYLPSALAMTLLALLVQRFGARFFSAPAALFAALFLLLSPLSMRLFILLRTDAVFAFFVGTAAFAAWHAWSSGSGWTLFWLLAAMGTLTKGPLAVLLALSGLLAFFWERRSGSATSLRGRHVAGLFLYLLLTAGWFGLAYLQLGDALTDKIIRRELVAHAVDIGDADPLFVRVFKPFIYFVHRVLPWSLLTLAALWRVIRHPAPEPGARRFERFLTCWFVGGLAIFSVTQHQRGDLLAPILAPAMLLAGREAACLLARISPSRQVLLAALLAAASLLQAAWYYHRVEPQTAPVRQTERIRAFAAETQAQWGDDPPFDYVDAPYTFQLYLGTMKRNLTVDDAARRLAGPDPAWMVISEPNAARVRSLARNLGKDILEVARCAENGTTLFVIVGNQAMPVSPTSR